MSGPAEQPCRSAEQTLSLDEVGSFREAAVKNDYRLVRVRSGTKKPLPYDWQHGDRRDALLDAKAEAANTGLLLAGLRCIDLDVDDPKLVSEIFKQLQVHLPRDALIRWRDGSPRSAVLYRALEGEPTKRSVVGSLGKVEVLGAGQQLVVHGLHPSGVALRWLNGRGPDTVPRDQLPAVSEEQIRRFLAACAPLLGVLPEYASVLPARPDTNSVVINSELSAGIEPHQWFPRLSAENMSGLVTACFDALDNRKIDPRDRWLQAIFAAADAELLGCSDARQAALEWSQRGASWTGEADFDAVWNSFKPGLTSVGSLLAMARDAGLNLSPWRDPALADGQDEPSAPHDPVKPPHAILRAPRALSIADLPLIPPKREWLHGTDLVRGAVSLLVAPGGRGKSSWLVSLALACASGRALLGAHVFGGPLRVLLINAEDATNEIALRVRAAMQHHGLEEADVAGLRVAGADRFGAGLLKPIERAPALDVDGWAALISELDAAEADVLIIDPLVSVMGGVTTNDNAAAALLMSRLVALAAERRMAMMVAHHASKGRDPVSAESAMGAASFVNLARIALGIELLGEDDAEKLFLPRWEFDSVFRVVGTKQNLSPPGLVDRWFRLKSVEMQNASPPIYPSGDQVGVVERFRPDPSAVIYAEEIIRAALRSVHDADPPLTPSKRSRTRYAAPVIAQSIAPHRNGRASEVEAEAVLNHLLRIGLIVVEDVKLTRPGGRSDARQGLIVTPAGRAAIQV